MLGLFIPNTIWNSYQELTIFDSKTKQNKAKQRNPTMSKYPTSLSILKPTTLPTMHILQTKHT